MITTLPISACLIVKDEEMYIEQCIQSLKPVVNEIIVVDTGSTDQTLAKLEQNSINVFHYEWNNSFSEARNYAISLASEPTILVIDADETLDPSTVPSLNEYLSHSRNLPASVNIVSKLDRYRNVNSRITRLFPNSEDYRYHGMIHEQLYYKGNSINEVKTTNVVLHHFGYDEAEVKKKQKINRNLELLEKQLKSEPESTYLRYQIGQTYYVGGHYHQAIENFDEVLQLISSQDTIPSFLPTVFLSYGYCLHNTSQYPILDRLLNDAFEFFPDYTDLYFLYGVSLIQRGNLKDIEVIKETFEHCIAMGEVTNPIYESVEGVGSYRSYYNLGVYYEATNQVEIAINCYNESAEMNFEPARIRVENIKKHR
ncbi:hypothetical protein JCM10914A_15230 [Paenibacillus sp. JCM 10914]|uniref:glycosyltransferase n=1 Tax=Paenibacillus sp. JCM 10914 TaxID=1236974 RepID=UPI0003CCA1C1|nr:glycosyltransferase [Paenibacillus sp. JCM 10914]GAE09107.1 glycosyl transferase, group 2 family protein [Paenibacillus sp. JCM 10914]